MTDQAQSDKNMSAIDVALQKLKARKAMKTGGDVNSTENIEQLANGMKVKLTVEEKAAAKEVRDKERDERKVRLAGERDAKKASAAMNRQPAHMKKVQKAAERLNPLGQAAQLLFNEATHNLTSSDLTALAIHISMFNRTKATERAATTTVKEGQDVEIVSGDPRYIGKRGKIVKSQRIRCYVNIAGENNRPIPNTDATGIYFFTSDCAPVVIGTVEVAEIEEIDTAIAV